MSQTHQKQLVSRLSRIEGQVRGLKKMLETGKECSNVLIQSLAVKNSLESFNTQLFEKHLIEHMHLQKKRAMEELVEIYKLSNK